MAKKSVEPEATIVSSGGTGSAGKESAGSQKKGSKGSLKKITQIGTHQKKTKHIKKPKVFVIDTNVLIHDPNSLQNFEENHIILPITVLEELDKHKYGNSSKAFECRQAIRLIDQIVDKASPEAMKEGVPIYRADGNALGSLSIILPTEESLSGGELDNHLNDNVIINCALSLKDDYPQKRIVLVSKDINMRLKARSAGLEAQDYQNDQLISDEQMLRRGYHEFDGVFWNEISDVQTLRDDVFVDFVIETEQVKRILGIEELYPNEFICDSADFVGRVVGTESVEEGQPDKIRIRHIKKEVMMNTEVWGLEPLDLPQAMALNLLIDPSISIVTLTGAAGSGKTILALAAAIEMVIENKRYNKIIATRSTPPLAEDHGFLPGTEEEKMNPWLGAISDNIEALHQTDENPSASIQYVKDKANIQFKALNYIRGRSFQKSFIMIDECQNLTPHQVKAIITRAGMGSKVICLGNLQQIDTPYLNSLSSGLTYLMERFKDFPYGGNIALEGVPRSGLAEYATENL